jgi:hypothetical protein
MFFSERKTDKILAYSAGVWPVLRSPGKPQDILGSECNRDLIKNSGCSTPKFTGHDYETTCNLGVTACLSGVSCLRCPSRF